jgi:hypothetical protein
MSVLHFGNAGSRIQDRLWLNNGQFDRRRITRWLGVLDGSCSIRFWGSRLEARRRKLHVSPVLRASTARDVEYNTVDVVRGDP